MWSSLRKLPYLKLGRLYFFNLSKLGKPNKIITCCLCKDDCLINFTTKICFSSFKTSVPDVDKRLELIKMEYRMLLDTGENVPASVSNKHWQKLVELSSFEERKFYYNYLYKTEVYILNDKKKKENKQVEREQSLAERDEKTGDHLSYGLFRNSFLYYLSNTRMLITYCWLQLSALSFGQIMVIDLDYDHLMNEKDLMNTADQIQTAYGLNKVSKIPWNMYMCNAKPNSPLLKLLKLSLGHLETPHCLITVTEKSYLDILPREKLIYLSDSSPKLMHEFDHDAIYIIGGHVDKCNPIPASMAKAKKENLTALQLPLYKYLPMATARKTLTINQVAGILIDLKINGDWNTALKHVPSRKLRANFYGTNVTNRPTYGTYRGALRSKSLFNDLE